jgi:hypothetical protein
MNEMLVALRAAAEALKIRVVPQEGFTTVTLPDGSLFGKLEVVFGWDGTSQETWEETFENELDALIFAVGTQVEAFDEELHGHP